MLSAGEASRLFDCLRRRDSSAAPRNDIATPMRRAGGTSRSASPFRPIFPRGWLINTIGIAAHGIARKRIRTRATTAADVFELTDAALTGKLRIVTHAL